MQKVTLLIILLCCSKHLLSQNINADILTKPWNAKWINVPGAKPHYYGVYYFDTKDKKYFSQHAKALAVLTGIIDKSKSHELGIKLIEPHWAHLSMHQELLRTQTETLQ